jgi:hypothetical protein
MTTFGRVGAAAPAIPWRSLGRSPRRSPKRFQTDADRLAVLFANYEGLVQPLAAMASNGPTAGRRTRITLSRSPNNRPRTDSPRQGRPSVGKQLQLECSFIKRLEFDADDRSVVVVGATERGSDFIWIGDPSRG